MLTPTTNVIQITLLATTLNLFQTVAIQKILQVWWYMAKENFIPTQLNQEMINKKGYRIGPAAQGQDQRFSLLHMSSALPMTILLLAFALRFLGILFPLLLLVVQLLQVACTNEHDGSWCILASIVLLHLLTVRYTCEIVSYNEI
jgi:hypothetical protein